MKSVLFSSLNCFLISILVSNSAFAIPETLNCKVKGTANIYFNQTPNKLTDDVKNHVLKWRVVFTGLGTKEPRYIETNNDKVKRLLEIGRTGDDITFIEADSPFILFTIDQNGKVFSEVMNMITHGTGSPTDAYTMVRDGTCE